MKKILLIILVLFASQIKAQNNQTTDVNKSGLLNFGEQSIGLASGIDYSIMPIQINYRKGFKVFDYKYPLISGVDVTIPLFNLDLNDIRIRITSETTILRKNNFEIRGGIDAVFANVKMDTETMSSLGADFHLFTGYISSNWTAGFDINYNNSSFAPLKH